MNYESNKYCIACNRYSLMFMGCPDNFTSIHECDCGRVVKCFMKIDNDEINISTEDSFWMKREFIVPPQDGIVLKFEIK